MVPSMSRRGNYHDNAVAENFFSVLKKERATRRIYLNPATAASDTDKSPSLRLRTARPKSVQIFTGCAHSRWIRDQLWSCVHLSRAERRQRRVIPILNLPVH